MVQKCKEKIHDYVLKVRELDVKRVKEDHRKRFFLFLFKIARSSILLHQTIDERFKEKQFKDPTTLTRIIGARFLRDANDKLFSYFFSSKEELIKGFEESKNLFKELIDKGNTKFNAITIKLLEDTPQPANAVTPANK